MDNGMALLKELLARHDLGLSDALIILQHQFSRGVQPDDRYVVIYAHDDGPPALTLHYNRKGRITKLEAGPGLAPTDIDDVMRILTAARPTHAWGTFSFANVPITGWWRYGDRFQLLPPPRNAPVPQQLIGDHPFVLEVAYEGADDFWLDQSRASRATREVSLLLSGVLHGVEDRTGHFTQREWVYLPPHTDEHGVLQLESQFLQVGYTADGFAPRRDTLSDRPPRAASLELIPASEYYSDYLIRGDAGLRLPDNLGAIVDAYFALAADDQERLLRWCHWLNHGRHVWSLSPSAAHIAVVQAVEALMPSGEDAPRCKRCGLRTGPSSGQRFADFLERYAPGPERRRERKEFYNLRSALSHGGKLLSGELFGHAFVDFTPTSWDERDVLSTTLRLTRLAGVNWLLSNYRSHAAANA